MRRRLPNITGWAWPLVWIQSLFSRKPSQKYKYIEKVAHYVAYFDLVLHSRFKTKRSLRSDRQNDRSTDEVKITTATLWRMHPEG